MKRHREWRCYDDPTLYVNGQPTDKQLYLSALHRFDGDVSLAKDQVRRVLNMEREYRMRLSRNEDIQETA